MTRDPYTNDLTPYEQMIRERAMTEEISRQREEARRSVWAWSEQHRKVSEQWFREWMKRQ